MDNSAIDIVVGLIWFILVAAMYLWTSLAAAAVFGKAGRPTWPAWVPVYNVMELFRLAGLSPWFGLLVLITPATAFVWLFLALRLGPRFGLAPGWAALAFFAFPIWLSVVGWGSARWLGEDADPYQAPRRSGGTAEFAGAAGFAAPQNPPAAGYDTNGYPLSPTASVDAPSGVWDAQPGVAPGWLSTDDAPVDPVAPAAEAASFGWMTPAAGESAPQGDVPAWPAPEASAPAWPAADPTAAGMWSPAAPSAAPSWTPPAAAPPAPVSPSESAPIAPSSWQPAPPAPNDTGYAAAPPTRPVDTVASAPVETISAQPTFIAPSVAPVAAPEETSAPRGGATRMREDSEVVAHARAALVSTPVPPPASVVADEPVRPIIVPAAPVVVPPPPVPPAPVLRRTAVNGNTEDYLPRLRRDRLDPDDLELSAEVSAIVGAPSAGLPRSAKTSVSAQTLTTDAVEDDLESTILAVRRRPVWHLHLPSAPRPIDLTAAVVLLGRKPVGDGGAQLVPVLDDTRTVSKTHARLELIDGEWFITDLGSTNGIVLFDEFGGETEIATDTATPLTERFLLGDAELRLTAPTA